MDKMSSRTMVGLLTVAVIAVSGVYLLARSHAATSPVSAEAEAGTLAGSAVLLDDATASGNKAVRFGAVTAGERWSTLHPFLSSAYSNTSVGSGITTSTSSPMTAALKLRSAAFNSARWSIPVYEAAAGDPTFTVQTATYSMTMQIPDAATPAAGTDAHMSITQTDRRTDYEMWGASKSSTGQWTAKYIVRTDLLSSGMAAGARASGISHLHGMIRTEEVASLHIPARPGHGNRRNTVEVRLCLAGKGPGWRCG
jgi:hypothetical protein